MDCSMNSHPWCWSSCGLPAELPDFPQMGLQCHDQFLIIGYFSLFGSDLIRYVTRWLTGLWQAIQEIRRKIMKKTGRYRGRMTEKGKVGKTRRIPQKLLPVHHPLPSTRPSESTPAGSRAAADISEYPANSISEIYFYQRCDCGYINISTLCKAKPKKKLLNARQEVQLSVHKQNYPWASWKTLHHGNWEVNISMLPTTKWSVSQAAFQTQTQKKNLCSAEDSPPQAFPKACLGCEFAAHQWQLHPPSVLHVLGDQKSLEPDGVFSSNLQEGCKPQADGS